MKDNNAIVVLGMFDGVHRGHRRLFEEALRIAKDEKLHPMVYTFSNMLTGNTKKEQRLLFTRAESFKRIRSCGIETIVADTFDDNMRNTEPESFIDMLKDRFSMKVALAGDNYTFGRYGRGNSADLLKYGEEKGFKSVIVPGVMYDGKLISSTDIRRLIESGDMERANRMLGQPYSVEGMVKPGRHIGQSIGFPTANIGEEALEGCVVPDFGVYVTKAYIDNGSALPSVTNVGTNPTVGGAGVTVETHILGMNGELYGRELRVEFLKKLRPQVRFADKEALSRQIALDVSNTRDYFLKNN